MKANFRQQKIALRQANATKINQEQACQLVMAGNTVMKTN
jgi:hypothetical protein